MNVLSSPLFALFVLNIVIRHRTDLSYIFIKLSFILESTLDSKDTFSYLGSLILLTFTL